MRLLKRSPSGDFELESFDDEHPPSYAILSHTWTEGQEVTYNELVAGTGKDKAGYNKLRFCVNRAAEDGIHYSWVDTCCIDRSTSDELSTAINSMFRWYQRATKCYAYLSDVSVSAEVADIQAFRITWEQAFRRSRWFTRGWTLQELIAPPTVEFFSKEGRPLGSKISLEQEIHEITKVPLGVLRGQHLTGYSVEERMSWAAKRTTRLKEDKVYCLLGIFGVFLSLIYGEGEEYATLRLKEEIQKRQEGRGTERLHDLPGTPSYTQGSSSLPFLRNELFIGREDKLQYLEQFLLLPDTHRRMTIYGLGGCGKSALALEFAYRALARNATRLLFWVPAISQESFEIAYRDIGIRLRIPGITDDNADTKQLVKEALSSNSVSDWLMIVDNADDPSVIMGGTGRDQGSSRLYDYLPHSNPGKILFTTRSRKVAEDLSQSNVLDLDDVDKAEAKLLLARRISNQALLDDGEAVDKMLESLAYLPLAIVQAAAFINSNDISVSGYISLFQKADTETELFSEQFEDPSRYREMESTIAKTWHISFDQVRKQDPLAAEYLSFMACIDRINIPQSLLPPGGSSLQQAKAIGTLKGYAFITERQQSSHELENRKFFDMHRLVHMASIWWLEGHNEQTAWMAKAAARLENLIPYGGHKGKDKWIAYLPHAIHMARLDSPLDKITKASLLDRIGRCQGSLGQFATAEKTHRRALSIREEILGREHNSTLISMNDVGVVLDNQGKYKEAESMHRETLARREEVLGMDHPDTLTSVHNLALVLHSQGKYKDAESMYRQTIEQSEKLLGAEHPDTLMSMNNLALVLDRQRMHKEAESMSRTTLERRKKVLGLDHPDTLTSINNLALVLDNQGEYKDAELMYRQTIEQSEKVLGPEHPDTLMSKHNLASVLSLQGKHDEAEAMHRQMLEQRERVLGPEHPNTLMTLYFLACLVGDRNRYDESFALFERASAGLSAVLGKDHPTSRNCNRDFSKMIASKEKALGAVSQQSNGNMNMRTGKRSKLSRGLAKIGIKSSRFSRS